MIYEFVNVADESERIEVVAPSSKAVPIGGRIKRAGKTYRRVPSLPMAAIAPDQQRIAWSVDPCHPGIKHHTPDGLPAFTSQRDREHFKGVSEDIGLPVVLDP